jgi:hypothetical protein
MKITKAKTKHKHKGRIEPTKSNIHTQQTHTKEGYSSSCRSRSARHTRSVPSIDVETTQPRVAATAVTVPPWPTSVCGSVWVNQWQVINRSLSVLNRSAVEVVCGQ